MSVSNGGAFQIGADYSPTGNWTFSGTTTLSGSGATFTAPVVTGGLTASGSASNNFSGSTGAFQTSTGANTLNGATTISAATPSLTTAAGQTNTGFLQINGKTSGAWKMTTADATAQTVTETLAAQTVGAASLTIPNFAGVSDTYTFNTLASTLSNKTIAAPIFSGSATGTYTLAGTPTITNPVISTLGSNQSVSTVSTAFGSDTYLVGSSIAKPTQGWTVGACYICQFDMVKTNAGSAALVVTLRIGTAQTTSDAAIITTTFGAGTAAADTGSFLVYAYFRTVGSGTSAVMVGLVECSHALAATGLISTGASGFGSITTVSSGFDSTIASTFIGLSVNGGASFSGTNTIVKAQLETF